MRSAPDDRWASYARTVVRIAGPDGPLVVGAAPTGEVGEWPWGSLQSVFVLTAWDPGAGRPGDAVNRRRQAALETELAADAIGVWPAVGRDPWTGHRDEGVAVAGLAEPDVLALGSRYGQDAVFRWTPGDWSIVSCDGERTLALGWSLTKQPGGLPYYV